MKVYRFPELREKTGLSRTSIWRLEKAKKFPRNFKISAQSVGWLKEDVDQWIRDRSGK